MFVIDDGETLAEVTGQPQAVTAAEWPSYAAGRFEDERARAEAALNPGPGPPADDGPAA